MAQFTDDQILAMVLCREAIKAGFITDDTIEERRLRFQRILAQSGCYHDDGGPWPKRWLDRAA